MRRIEACAPVELIDSLRVELLAAGITAPITVTMQCGLLNTRNGGALIQDNGDDVKPTHCKFDLIVSDRLVPRAVEIISHLLQAKPFVGSFSQLVIFEVEGNYHFGPQEH